MALGCCQWAMDCWGRKKDQGISINHCPCDWPLIELCMEQIKIWVSPYLALLLIVGPPSSKDLSRLAPPWQRWEPEPNFLNELQKWNNTHKNDKLPAVLAKVNSILESKPIEAALEFIPDSPFPAKSLVKAIINLFLLGSVSDCLLADTCDLPSTQIHYISST